MQSKIFPLIRPITFKCTVAGLAMKASITAEEHNLIQGVYHVSFSDGHTGIFCTDEDFEGWLEEGVAHSEYAKAIQDDLYTITGFDHDYPPFAIPVFNGEERFNVWIEMEKPGEGTYVVSYKGDYRFDVKKVGDEFVTTTVARHRGYINRDIERIVKEKLRQRTA